MSAYVKDLNLSNLSIKNVKHVNLFPGWLVVNRDTFLEAWRADPSDDTLNLVSTYQVRGTIKEIESFYSPVYNQHLLLVLIKDVKLVVLRFDHNLAEFENVVMYNFEQYRKISGKITSNNDHTNLLNVYNHGSKTVISLLVGDLWLAVLRVKDTERKEDLKQEVDNCKYMLFTEINIWSRRGNTANAVMYDIYP
jgi:hypothetical protein